MFEDNKCKVKCLKSDFRDVDQNCKEGDMDGLEVVDDSKVLNINIVHIIIKQVDPTTAEVRTLTRLKPTC